MSFLTRRKSIDGIAHHEGHVPLKPTLSWYHLIAMGVGAIVGTGIYTLTGIGAGLAGPGVLISFAICGVICGCAAFCYTEMATIMPAAGSAYTFTYGALGETLAWIVGWSLILEYTVAAAAVSVGWSAHVAELIQAHHWPVPAALLNGCFSSVPGGLVNLPAVAIAFVVTALLVFGTRESATFNIFLVSIKMLALVLFVFLAIQAFDPAKLKPLMPYGFFGHVGPDGVKRGVMTAASLVFFAFYGFDTVSTAAEETKRPGRDLAIGIMGSMVLCTLIYMFVAFAALGASPYAHFSQSAAPLIDILKELQHPLAAQIVTSAVIIALPSVILVLMYGQSRIFFVMARDGLLPQELASVSKARGTPVVMTVITGVFIAILAGVAPLKTIAEVANAGTLCAFIAVAASMMVLRLREPDRARVFKTPLWWLLGPICIIGCLYLFLDGLPQKTRNYFFMWNAIGLVIYFCFGMRNSLLARAKPAATLPAAE